MYIITIFTIYYAITGCYSYSNSSTSINTSNVYLNGNVINYQYKQTVHPISNFPVFDGDYYEPIKFSADLSFASKDITTEIANNNINSNHSANIVTNILLNTEYQCLFAGTFSSDFEGFYGQYITKNTTENLSIVNHGDFKHFTTNPGIIRSDFSLSCMHFVEALKIRYVSSVFPFVYRAFMTHLCGHGGEVGNIAT